MAVEQHNRLIVAIESGHDPADVGRCCGGVRQDERDDYLASHYVLLFMAFKPESGDVAPDALPLAGEET